MAIYHVKVVIDHGRRLADGGGRGVGQLKKQLVFISGVLQIQKRTYLRVNAVKHDHNIGAK